MGVQMSAKQRYVLRVLWFKRESGGYYVLPTVGLGRYRVNVQGLFGRSYSSGQVKILIFPAMSTQKHTSERVWQCLEDLNRCELADEVMIQTREINNAVVLCATRQLPRIFLGYACNEDSLFRPHHTTTNRHGLLIDACL